jgi:hypothetical protein
MSASTRDLERAAQVQLVRAQRAEEKAEDTQHALNLLLNPGFERFHVALTSDGAVHCFELGIVRNPPEPEWITDQKRARGRRIVLWRTTFPQGHLYASAFHESEFRSLPKHSARGSELRNLLDQAIEQIPTRPSVARP